MSLKGKRDIFYVNLGGTIGDFGSFRYAFYAPKNSYKNIGSTLGVNQVGRNDKSLLVFGANNPRPARVRITYIEPVTGVPGIGGPGGDADDIIRSVLRFAEPDKTNTDNLSSLRGKKVFVDGADQEFTIQQVTLRS